ncbi:hypothetical protein CYMTET_23616 [Cymbomonas tetramitiformis]|uniref:Uncharacterized protein n=1 Tax=Cymbomonas tetramitiformis TaxID=36881 RepID=A0AAE0FY51_9CHLO|nr:hypothetical protein CYMTET_23616 [Cymbomonas tetramitiformis]
MSSGNDRLILWTSSVAKAKLWTLLHFSKEVQQHTDVLLEAALLSLDSSGAFSVGLWPALSGTWASRKGAEFEKFHQVTTWAQAMLQLAVPILRPGQLFRLLVDQHQVRREQARAQLHLPALLGRVAPVALLGRPGSQDGWGHGRSGHRDCRNGGHYPCGSGISGRVRGSHCFGFGPNARCFGYALSDFGGAGLAPAGAALVSDGTVPPEAELLAQALHDSLATTEGWDMAKCAQACADLVHEAAKLRSQLTLLKGIHPFGKLPMKALEVNAFPAMVYALPELPEEECELDELPTGKEATVEHWRAFVHILQARVGEFQRFVKSKVPSFPLTDVMPATFFKKRKRVTFDGEEEEARAAGGGSGLLPPLDAARREHLAALGSTFKTVNEEQLVRALRGELAPEEMVRPPGAGAPSTAIPSRGPLAGVNLLVAPVQHLQQEDEGIKWKDGDLTVVPKSRKCKDMAEWERGFLRIMCEAPAEARDDLVDFVEWAKSIAADYNFFHFFEFYEHLIRQPGQPKRKRGDYKWKREDANNGKGAKGKGKGGVVPPGEPESSQQAPAGAEKDPAVETDTAPEVEKEIEMEDVLAETEGVELADMEADVEMSPKLPAEVVASERWWADLRADEFIPVWDVLGGPRRHARVPLRWEVERIAPLPVTHTCPDTWRLPEEPGRVRMSTRWPALREKILQRATIENMEACGKGENERRCYEEEGERVGCSIPTLTSRAPLVAVAFQDWHDVDFLVRCAACGAGWPSGEIEVGEPNRVPNYVGPEHMDVMRDEIRRESEEGRIFRTRWRLPLSIIALGMVEKADMETAYRSKGIASMYWTHQCFEFDGERWMDARAPFGDRALPGIFMRRMVRMPHQVLEDLAVLKQVVRQYRGKRVVLERRLVDERDFATDASGTLGVWEKLFFILSWADLARLPQRPWFPSRVYEFGPFTVDACVAESKANSYCYPSWSRMKDARVQKFDGHNAWGNLPFSGMLSIIENFLRCKRRQLWGTAACFQKLQREAERYRAQALAPETRRCYGTGVRAFVIFCISFASLGCLDPLLPATDKSLCMFITYFSWHAVAATPQGVKRCWERPPKPVMPLTLEDLAKMALLISMHDLGYAGHSLRRGGATAAKCLDVNSMYIKMQGDWKSDCFERYYELGTEQKLILLGAMAEAAAALL